MKLGHGVEAPVYGSLQVLVPVLGLYFSAACLLLVDLDVGVGEKAGDGLSLNGHVHDQLILGHPDRGEVSELWVDIIEPDVPSLVDVHVAVHDPEAVLGHKKGPSGIGGGRAMIL